MDLKHLTNGLSRVFINTAQAVGLKGETAKSYQTDGVLTPDELHVSDKTRARLMDFDRNKDGNLSYQEARNVEDFPQRPANLEETVEAEALALHKEAREKLDGLKEAFSSMSRADKDPKLLKELEGEIAKISSLLDSSVKYLRGPYSGPFGIPVVKPEGVPSILSAIRRSAALQARLDSLS